MAWTVIGDTRLTKAQGLKIRLKGGADEIIRIPSTCKQLVAQTPNMIDQKSNRLEIGIWDSKGEWTAIAVFVGGTWENVVPFYEQ